jgi:hypothetical protein
MNSGFLKKLTNCYETLSKCDLVVNKQVTNENIKLFKSVLNSAQPNSTDELCHKNMIYILFGRNIDDFYNYVISRNMPYFILWLNSKYIINHFGLDKLVYMKWSDGLYYAYKYRPKPNHDEENVENSSSGSNPPTSTILNRVEDHVSAQVDAILQTT